MPGLPGYVSPGHVADQYKNADNLPHTSHHDTLADRIDAVEAVLPQVIADLADVVIGSMPGGTDQIVLTFDPATSHWIPSVNSYTATTAAAVTAATNAANSATTAANAASTAAAAASSAATANANTLSEHGNSISQLQGQVGSLLDQVVLD